MCAPPSLSSQLYSRPVRGEKKERDIVKQEDEGVKEKGEVEGRGKDKEEQKSVWDKDLDGEKSMYGRVVAIESGHFIVSLHPIQESHLRVSSVGILSSPLSTPRTSPRSSHSPRASTHDHERESVSSRRLEGVCVGDTLDAMEKLANNPFDDLFMSMFMAIRKSVIDLLAQCEAPSSPYSDVPPSPTSSHSTSHPQTQSSPAQSSPDSKAGGGETPLSPPSVSLPSPVTATHPPTSSSCINRVMDWINQGSAALSSDSEVSLSLSLSLSHFK